MLASLATPRIVRVVDAAQNALADYIERTFPGRLVADRNLTLSASAQRITFAAPEVPSDGNGSVTCDEERA